MTDEVQYMIANGVLSPDSSAVGPGGGAMGLRKYGAFSGYKSHQQLDYASTARQRDSTYKPFRHWADSDNLKQELHAFLREYQAAADQPTVWMLRKTHFEQAGRGDLADAVYRNGGPDSLAERYGLVPYSQWHHFDKQLAVFKSLQSYIEQFGTPGYMPTLSDMENRDWCQLRDGVTKFGAKILAAKLCLRTKGRQRSTANADTFQKHAERRHKEHALNVEYEDVDTINHTKVKEHVAYIDELGVGPFDLDFAVQLLEYTKSVQYRRLLDETSAAVKRGDADRDWDSKITMPFRHDLLADGQEQLVAKIDKYGGFECVARRSQLEYADRDLKELNIVRARDAVFCEAPTGTL
eukprot:8633-Heterococcus_DN1.PRE.1